MATGFSDFVDASFCWNGGCMRCMTQTNGLVDTGADVPFEGIMALCRGCVTDLAAAQGLKVYDFTSHEEALNEFMADAEAWRKRALDAEDLLTKVAASATRIKNLTPKTDAGPAGA